MGLGTRILFITTLGAAFGLGAMVGGTTTTNQDPEYEIIRQEGTPFLYNKTTAAQIQIQERYGRIECGDINYRTEGVLQEGYSNFLSFLGVGKDEQ